MILLNKDQVFEKIKEAAPRVEDITKLKTDLNGLEVNLLKRREIIKNEDGNFLQRYASGIFDSALYNYNPKGIDLPKLVFGNEDEFGLTIGHELVHNIQSSNFPQFYENPFNVTELDYFAEGDASLVEDILYEKFYQNAKVFGDSIFRFLNNLIFPEDCNLYDRSKEILKKKFNGNRKDINELYAAPIEEFKKIFGEN